MKRRAEFEFAFHANKVSNKWFVVYVNENKGNLSRLGMVVNKKVMPKATTRNYAKRLVREVFRKDFPSGIALDIVVRLRRPISPGNSQEERQALQQLLLALQK